MEKKKSYHKVAKLYKIANYFGVQIEDLLSNTGD
uniref:Protein-turn-helix DNA binding protein n=1 Tax=Siphoviridae sp. ctNYt19 TaxID=2825472 RepID=A0A8S5QJL3_9CAUD|nr:MAG TPA: protein-turn-helix DNA binding protein [Siphoviridae sp. ctNYt19]